MAANVTCDFLFLLSTQKPSVCFYSQGLDAAGGAGDTENPGDLPKSALGEEFRAVRPWVTGGQLSATPSREAAPLFPFIFPFTTHSFLSHPSPFSLHIASALGLLVMSWKSTVVA